MTTWHETAQNGPGRVMGRVRQFLAALWPRVSRDDRALVATLVPGLAVMLFARMSRRDQRHSLNVLVRVQQVAPDQPDLLAAALLHDIAKTAIHALGAQPSMKTGGLGRRPARAIFKSVQPGRRLRLHHRVLVVLMEAVRPGWVQQIARDDPKSWRYPFYLHAHHPELGARLAEQAGCSPLTVELIRRHQDKLDHAPQNEMERLLALLQAADDAG